MTKQNQNIEKHDYNKISMPDYLQGYKIEREFGNKKIEECVREMISLHIHK